MKVEALAEQLQLEYFGHDDPLPVLINNDDPKNSKES